MFHLKFPKFRGYYTWEELGYVSLIYFPFIHVVFFLIVIINYVVLI